MAVKDKVEEYFKKRTKSYVKRHFLRGNVPWMRLKPSWEEL